MHVRSGPRSGGPATWWFPAQHQPTWGRCVGQDRRVSTRLIQMPCSSVNTARDIAKAHAHEAPVGLKTTRVLQQPTDALAIVSGVRPRPSPNNAAFGISQQVIAAVRRAPGTQASRAGGQTRSEELVQIGHVLHHEPGLSVVTQQWRQQRAPQVGAHDSVVVRPSASRTRLDILPASRPRLTSNPSAAATCSTGLPGTNTRTAREQCGGGKPTSIMPRCARRSSRSSQLRAGAPATGVSSGVAVGDSAQQPPRSRVG